MFSRFFIERPIFANVLAIITMLIGAVTVFVLPIEQYPQITPPTVQARGIFPNPGRVIVPGLFVRVRVALDEKPNALLVPEEALGTDQAGPYLLIVEDRNKVGLRRVKVGSQEGNLRVIAENLGPDDLVIVNGLQKARPGSEVKPTRKDQAGPAPAVADAGAEPSKIP